MLYAKLGGAASDIVIMHLTRTFCLPKLLYGLESFTVSKSYLSAIEFCWYRVMFRLFNISSRDNMNYVLYYTGILPLSYQVDLRKLRFYHAKYTCETDSIVWHVLDSIVWHVLGAVSKRQIDTVMTDYSVYNFTTDAVYTRAIWAKFELLEL